MIRNVLAPCIAVVVVCIVVPILFFPVAAQDVQSVEKSTEPVLELTEIEQLKLSILMKDVLLANQQLQLIQAQFKDAVVQRDARQAELQRSLYNLRAEHKTPVGEFDFDPGTFRFIPVPKVEEAKE